MANVNDTDSVRAASCSRRRTEARRPLVYAGLSAAISRPLVDRTQSGREDLLDRERRDAVSFLT